jgi:adenylate cyclase class IV
MKETEKRAGMTLSAAIALKPAIHGRYTYKSTARRAVVVKVDNDDFSPNPDAMVDIKTKLIGDQTVLSVKHGSWHGDSARQEHEVNFRRADLGAVFAIMKLLGYAKFIVLETVRTTWVGNGVIITLDEYGKVGKALFEVELEDSSTENESLIDEVFAVLGLSPMNSAETIQFISELNDWKEIQVDLDQIEAHDFAQTILEEYTA